MRSSKQQLLDRPLFLERALNFETTIGIFPQKIIDGCEHLCVCDQLFSTIFLCHRSKYCIFEGNGLDWNTSRRFTIHSQDFYELAAGKFHPKKVINLVRKWNLTANANIRLPFPFIFQFAGKKNKNHTQYPMHWLNFDCAFKYDRCKTRHVSLIHDNTNEVGG